MPLTCKIKSQIPELMLFVHGNGKLVETDIVIFTKFFNNYLHGNDTFRVFFDLRQVTDAPVNVIKEMAKYVIV